MVMVYNHKYKFLIERLKSKSDSKYYSSFFFFFSFNIITFSILKVGHKIDQFPIQISEFDNNEHSNRFVRTNVKIR